MTSLHRTIPVLEGLENRINPAPMFGDRKAIVPIENHNAVMRQHCANITYETACAAVQQRAELEKEHMNEVISEESQSGVDVRAKAEEREMKKEESQEKESPDTEALLEQLKALAEKAEEQRKERAEALEEANKEAERKASEKEVEKAEPPEMEQEKKEESESIKEAKVTWFQTRAMETEIEEKIAELEKNGVAHAEIVKALAEYPRYFVPPNLHGNTHDHAEDHKAKDAEKRDHKEEKEIAPKKKNDEVPKHNQVRIPEMEERHLDTFYVHVAQQIDEARDAVFIDLEDDFLTEYNVQVRQMVLSLVGFGAIAGERRRRGHSSDLTLGA